MKILWEKKINLPFKNTIKISPKFAKFLCGITAWSKSKLSALSSLFVHVSSLEDDLDNKQLYMAKTLHARVQLNGELCKALIDTRAKINIMTKEIKDQYNLFILINSNLQLISHTDHHWNFIEIYENIKVNISEVTIR